MSEPTAEQLIVEQKRNKGKQLFSDLKGVFSDLTWPEANNELLLINESISLAVDRSVKDKLLNSFEVETVGETDAAKERAAKIIALLADSRFDEAQTFIQVVQNTFQVSSNIMTKEKTVRELEEFVKEKGQAE